MSKQLDYITPYIYTVQVKGNIPLTVYYFGKKYIIETNIFQFSSTNKLSLEELAFAIKGTRNIIQINGDFREPELKKIKIL